MKKILVLISLSLLGCNSNYIRVVDLDQETMTCRSENNNQQAFVYPTAEFGVCMDKRLANYLYCVSTISLIKVDSTDDGSTTATISGIQKLLGSAQLTSTQKKTIVQTMASKGQLAKARAEAIEFCKTFSEINTPQL